MKLKYVHIADYATISREGKMSIIGMFTEINTNVVPAIQPQFFVVFLLELEEGDVGRKVIPISLKIVDPEGNELLGMSGELQGPDRHVSKGMGFMFRVDMFQLPLHGPYEVIASADGNQHIIKLSVGRG